MNPALAGCVLAARAFMQATVVTGKSSHGDAVRGVMSRGACLSSNPWAGAGFPK
jgi:hypothetical protein